MKLLKERIAALESMEERIKRRVDAIKSYDERVQKGKKNNFEGELFIWDQGGNNKIRIEIGALFTDQEIVAAIERTMDQIKEKAMEIRPVLEMAERALKN